MNTIKHIPVKSSDEKVYIFEFVEKKQKGIFVSGLLSVGQDEPVVIQFFDENNIKKLELAGKIAWINDVNDPGAGVVFPVISLKEFQIGTSIITRVAYI
jgi:Tfp pilus assembly protein PilZ